MATTQEHKGGSRAGKTVRQPEPPATGEIRQTPREIEGPYFRLGAPMRSNLLEPGDKPELVLTGRVLNEHGTPIPGAVVNIWSSDAVGNYDMLGYRYHGYVVTDAAAATSSRRSFPAATSRAMPSTFTSRCRVSAARSPHSCTSKASPATRTTISTHPSCWSAAPIDDNGTKHGTYDFVLKQVTERENVTPESLAARV